MYTEIINEIKSFLSSINIDSLAINSDEFQGIFIKKLSNQNIIKTKRRIPNGRIVSPINQTHIDITGNDSMLFFFEDLANTTTNIQDIDIDIFTNNFNYLYSINVPSQKCIDGNTVYSRSCFDPVELPFNNTLRQSIAYKKHGHAGDQVQINIPDQEEFFTKLHNFSYLDDALIMLRYDYFHYLAIIIPNEFCQNLYSLTRTYGNHNVNIAFLNPQYNSVAAQNIQQERILPNIELENHDLEYLCNTLLYNSTAGTDIEKMMKSRVSQGAFRRLLMLAYKHKCCLCDVTTTSVLRASHIKSWSDSTRKERVDINNGLLLCANHDTLFDRHLISFNPDTGEICISKSIAEDQRNALNISDTQEILISTDMRAYMELHKAIFSAKDNN